MKESWRQKWAGCALITGASSGLGLAFAHALAARDLDLILVARRKHLLQDIALELSVRHSVRVEVVAEDLTLPGADERVLDYATELGMSVGLLVNNAGFGTYGHFEKQDVHFEARMVDLNCRVPVLLTHRFLPMMLARRRGAIIMVSSMAAFQSTPYLAVYGATKAFNLSFGESLAGELQQEGIDVLTLAPGVVRTGFQAVANSHDLPFPGQEMDAPEVVDRALESLGKRHLITPGYLNRWLCRLSGWIPRRLALRIATSMLRPQSGQFDGN